MCFRVLLGCYSLGAGSRVQEGCREPEKGKRWCRWCNDWSYTDLLVGLSTQYEVRSRREADSELK